MSFTFRKHENRTLAPSPAKSEVLSFLVGSLFVAIAHKFLDKSLDLLPALLSVGVLAIAVWNILYVRSVASRMGRILEDSLVSVRYFHERFSAPHGFRPTGEIHKTLIDLVGHANCQIQIFGVYWDFEEREHEGLQTSARHQYLKAIERKLRDRAQAGFDYTRIIQVPAGRENDDLRSILDPVTYDHCRRVAEIEKANRGRSGFRVQFFVTSKRMAGGFMLLDQRYLSLGLDGTSVSSTPCFSALLQFEDKGGSFLRDWRRQFEEIQSSARAISVDSLLDQDSDVNRN